MIAKYEDEDSYELSSANADMMIYPRPFLEEGVIQSAQLSKEVSSTALGQVQLANDIPEKDSSITKDSNLAKGETAAKRKLKTPIFGSGEKMDNRGAVKSHALTEANSARGNEYKTRQSSNRRTESDKEKLINQIKEDFQLIKHQILQQRRLRGGVLVEDHRNSYQELPDPKANSFHQMNPRAVTAQSQSTFDMVGGRMNRRNRL